MSELTNERILTCPSSQTLVLSCPYHDCYYNPNRNPNHNSNCDPNSGDPYLSELTYIGTLQANKRSRVYRCAKPDGETVVVKVISGCRLEMTDTEAWTEQAYAL